MGKKNKITVIILAAGCSYKMKSYGARCLITLPNNMTVLERQIQIVKKAFTNVEIILICGVDAIKVMNSIADPIIKIENENYETTSSVRSLAIGLRAATSNKAIIIFGDLVFNEETLLNLDHSTSGLLLDNSGIMNKNTAGCIINTDNMIENMSYDLENKWVQIGLFVNKELALLKQIVWGKNKDKLLMFEVINDVINRGGQLKMLKPANMKIIDIDSAKDLHLIKRVI
jgi:bifunctional N-acetylglucosamine-1-phosphate-uridyltransferase/glucosamine-1-phosphate-acetyltransferase GlmU-like protein